MAERTGVEVYISWVDEEDETFLAEVDLMELAEVPGKIYHLLSGNPDVIVDRVGGYLDMDQSRLNSNVFRVEVYGQRGLTS